MKISKVIEILEVFNSDVYCSDITMGVHFGCSCGCGGDYYTDDSWDKMSNEYDAAEELAEIFCDENNLVYDWNVDKDEINQEIYKTKKSFDALFYKFSSCHINDIEESHFCSREDYLEEVEYYREFRDDFIEYCIECGFENDYIEKKF